VLLNKAHIRCAPTEKSAFLIKGSTIHNVFNIAVSNNQKEMSCNKLTCEKLNQLQLQFKGITHVIIDEYSRVSQGLFAQIDSRLRQATGNKEEFFGG
jgi:hypothetical protein